MNRDMVQYYKERALEYEKIYLKPERQLDLKKAAEVLKEWFSAKNVLEIACGTGYWTERIAETALSVFATDINERMIEVAKSKSYKNLVQFAVSDFYALAPAQKFDALFGGFIWSHILLQDLEGFLHKMSGLVQPGGVMVFMDNIYVEGSSIPVVHSDEQGNTYQNRSLENGSTHLVLKNFPSRDFILQELSRFSSAFQFVESKHYWIASCVIR